MLVLTVFPLHSGHHVVGGPGTWSRHRFYFRCEPLRLRSERNMLLISVRLNCYAWRSLLVSHWWTMSKELFLTWLQSTWKNINIVYHWLSPLSVLSLWSSVDLSCPADLSLCLRSLVCTRVLIPAGTCGGWTTALVSSDEESLLVLWPWLDPWDPPDDAWLPITDILRCWWYQLLVSAILSKVLSQTDNTGTCVLVFWS